MAGPIPQPSGLDSVAGTELEPFLRGFEECGFKFDVDALVERFAPLFAAGLCPDGSHPLAWTVAHNEYKQLFDAQLDTILEYHLSRCVDRAEFLEYCSRLAALAAGAGEGAVIPGTGVRAADFGRFLGALTASEDYAAFVHVMRKAAGEPCPAGGGEVFAAVAPETLADEAYGGKALDTPVAASREVEVEVSVPEGQLPGQLMAVECFGCRYELLVPDGCVAGSSFRAVVQAPAPAA